MYIEKYCKHITFCGVLIIAIFAVFFYNFFNRKVRKMAPAKLIFYIILTLNTF